MSNWDKDRYNSLIARCAFDMSAYKGTYQDQSRNRLAMTANGTPGWTSINGLPALAADGANDVRSAAVPQLVDVTGDFTVEVLASVPARMPNLVQHAAGNGGLYFGQPNGVLTRWELYLVTNAGAAAVVLHAPWTTADLNVPRHLIISSIGGGATGRAWFNSVPQTVTTVVTGAPANTPGAIVACGSLRTGYLSLIRLYPFAFTNADAAAAYGAARSLVGEI